MLCFRSMAPLLAALVVSCFVTACTNSVEKNAQAELERARVAQLSRAADEAAIRAATIAWSQASVARDLDKAVSVYADDAVVLAPGSPILRDKESIRKDWAGGFALPGPGLSFQAQYVEVSQAGDLAYEYGTYDFVTTDKKGKPTDAKGKFVVIWKKQPDNSWKVVVDTDNPSQ
ncbi:MAG: SgcJ/EcaC family oxidoreductase [Candidatus Acidiferrales bacterium]